MIVLFVLFSCRNSNNENAIDLREKKLETKENELLKLAEELKSKSIELTAREQLLDTLQSSSDTTGNYNPGLIGDWVVNMKCTETTCEGSAIGDSKTERWNISYVNNRVVARVISNEKVTRIYIGKYEKTGLTLFSNQEDKNGVIKMVILLSPLTGNIMKGTREINRYDNCKIVYSLEILKQNTSTQN